MSNIYRLGDVIREFNELWESSNSYRDNTRKYRWVDEDRFDIVPKREFLDKEIARKEEELKQVEIRHRQHEDRLKEEITGLKAQRKKRET